MNARFVFATLILSLLTSVSYADGIYQRTKDGKAIVWNNRPLPGDAAAWSGASDEKGYATGRGTLTWFTTEQKILTGSNIPNTKHIASSRYTGEMAKGKLAGMVVNIDANGRTFHGTFVEGRKGKDWKLGPAPATSVAASRAEPEPLKPATEVAAIQQPNEIATAPSGITAEQERTAQRALPNIESPSVEPPPPAEGPPQSQTSIPAQRPRPNEKPNTDAIVEAPTDYDESLRSLVGPPSGLRTNSMPSASPQASASAPPKTVTAAPSAAAARLNAAQVDEIADAEARTRGYSLSDFQHPQAKYDASSNSWTVTYERKSFDGYGMAAVGQSFTITIDDKTKKASLAPEK